MTDPRIAVYAGSLGSLSGDVGGTTDDERLVGLLVEVVLASVTPRLVALGEGDRSTMLFAELVRLDRDSKAVEPLVDVRGSSTPHESRRPSGVSDGQLACVIAISTRHIGAVENGPLGRGFTLSHKRAARVAGTCPA